MLKSNLLFFLALFFCQMSFAESVSDSINPLDVHQRNIIIISALTAQGNMPKLTTSLHEALDAGLSMNDIKEIMVQLYAYVGFPRSLNALNTLMAVRNDRSKKGIQDQLGNEPSIIASDKSLLAIGNENREKLTGTKIGGGIYDFVPIIDQFLKAHLFGAIFSRDNLDWKTRELITIAALASINGVEAQLKSHFGVGLYNGLSLAQLEALVTIIEHQVDRQRGMIARQVLQSVIEKKSYSPSILDYNNIFSRGEKVENSNFKGNVYLQMLTNADSLNATAVGNVTFEAGAHTKWHLHPAGQILMVIDGVGYYQERGQAKKILHKGDVVKCPPNIAHWHGASPDTHFIQVAITSNAKGSTIWLEDVAEEEYNSQNR